MLKVILLSAAFLAVAIGVVLTCRTAVRLLHVGRDLDKSIEALTGQVVALGFALAGLILSLAARYAH